MYKRTGDIIETIKMKDFLKEHPEEAEFFKKMKLKPTKAQLSRKPVCKDALGRVGRNDPCPCGSGIKFKKCCLYLKGVEQ